MLVKSLKWIMKKQKEKNDIRYDKRSLVTNSFMGLFWRGAGYLFTFLSAPVLLNLLGDEKYGVWATLLSFAGVVYTFDFGIGRGMRNKVAEALATNRITDARKYMAVSYILLGITSLVLFLVFAAFVYFTDIASFLKITYKEESVKAILITAVIFACINFVASIITNVLYAQQKTALAGFYTTLGQGLYALAVLLLGKLRLAYIGAVAAAQGVTQLLKNLIATGVFFIQNPELKFRLCDYEKEYSAGIVSFGLQMFTVNIAALILNSTDNIVISRYLGAVNVTPYSICVRYFSMIEAVYITVFSPVGAAYTAAYARKDIPWMNKALKGNLMGYFFFLAGIVLAGVLFKPFAKLWLGRELYFEKGLIFSVGLYYAMLIFAHVFSSLLTAVSMIRETMAAVIIQAIINIPVSVFLAVECHLGVTGVILGSVASMAVAVIVFPAKGFLVMWRLNQEYKKQK